MPFSPWDEDEVAREQTPEEERLLRIWLSRVPGPGVSPPRPWPTRRARVWVLPESSTPVKEESVEHSEQCRRFQYEVTHARWYVWAWASQGIFPPPLHGQPLDAESVNFIQGVREHYLPPVRLDITEDEAVAIQAVGCRAVYADVRARFPSGDPVVVCDCPPAVSKRESGRAGMEAQ
jgi:hypothetical protein